MKHLSSNFAVKIISIKDLVYKIWRKKNPLEILSK